MNKICETFCLDKKMSGNSARCGTFDRPAFDQLLEHAYLGQWESKGRRGVSHFSSCKLEDLKESSYRYFLSHAKSYAISYA